MHNKRCNIKNEQLSHWHISIKIDIEITLKNKQAINKLTYIGPIDF